MKDFNKNNFIVKNYYAIYKYCYALFRINWFQKTKYNLILHINP